jgi:hypothetical protein
METSDKTYLEIGKKLKERLLHYRKKQMDYRSLQFNTQTNNNVYDAIKTSGAFDLEKDLTYPVSSNVEVVKDVPVPYSREEILARDQVVLEKPNTSVLDSTSQQTQEDIIQIAADLSEDNNLLNQDADYTVSQIGDYQIWRDKDEIAIVNSESNQLVAYGETNNDFFTKRTPQRNIPNINDQSRLINKIANYNSGLNLEYKKGTVDRAYEFIQPYDPINKAKVVANSQINKPFENIKENIAETLNNVQKYIKDSSTKVQSVFNENISKVAINVKKKAKLIALKLNSNKLMKLSLDKFEAANLKTGESRYNIGAYEIHQNEDKSFKIYTKNKELLLSFEQKSDTIISGSKPVLRSHSNNLTEINNAVKTVSNPNNLATGNPGIEKEYQSKVFGLTQEISQYPNGKHQIADTYLFKTKDSLLITDSRGNQLIAADKNKNIGYVSINKLDELTNIASQDRKISQAAKTVEAYLKLNGVSKVDKPDFVVEFDQSSKTIRYLDKTDKSNQFTAKKSSQGWRRIEGDLAPEKSQYFVEIAQKIQRQQIKNRYQQPLERSPRRR